MEMASRRRNTNEGEDHKSHVYFPSWVYDQYSEGKEIEMGNGTEEKEKILKEDDNSCIVVNTDETN